MRILGVIPARYASTRFPAKALAQINGKPMVQWVYEHTLQAKNLDKVIIATDHELIAEAIESFSGEYVLTNPNHPSGTDRCFEALSLVDGLFDYVVNIQGDEPFINPLQIDTLTQLLDGEVQLATLVKQLSDPELLFSENTAKVVLNSNEQAMYFSRNPIPFLRNEPQENWLNKNTYWKHIGLYAYRTDVLEAITKLPQSSLEIAESLEQLRWLENGYKIKVAKTEYETLSVDTPADLENLLAYLKVQGI
jgi:3-deoxy-manno-octulosonate cytidylyltransferase (CMP-KDO synthetase)